MKRNRSLAASLALVFATGSCAATLPTFGADIGKESRDGVEVRPPYTSVVSYFGYVAPGAPPDEVQGGRKTFFVYFWIPVVAPELGVRMASPVGGLAEPAERGAFVEASYAEHDGESEPWFDTAVRVERCLSAINPEDIRERCEQWASYGENDDSAEMPATPAGGRHNSLLRIASSPDDPHKVLMRGMYRLAFGTAKAGEVQGTFLAQIGAPVELPGAAMARTVEELHRAVIDPRY